MRVLIMGLPGSGKTTMAKKLIRLFPSASWLNADEVRNESNDWDFSIEGRIRQAKRLRELADSSCSGVVLCDFIAGLEAQREIFDADFTIWMDTIAEGRFEDTNALFEKPHNYDLRINSWYAL